MNDETRSDQPSVLEVLRRRAEGDRSDDFLIALALEGGGMRGVVSGAMLLALRDMGLMPLFDRFYGTSSGSINLTYFAAGSGWDALSVYYDHLIAGFVLPRRLPHQPRLDMDYVFDRVMAKEVPLDEAALAASPYDVRIVLSDVDSLSPEIVEMRHVASEARSYLKAGAWLPILAGPPVRLHGRRYLDGGLLWPDPLYAALAQRCTHVLMLNTAPVNASGSTSRTSVMALERVLDRWSPGLGRAYRSGRRRWEVDRAHLVPGRSVTLAGTSVTRLQPPANSHLVQRLTLDRGALLHGARVGYSTVRTAFNRPLPGYYFSIVEHG